MSEVKTITAWARRQATCHISERRRGSIPSIANGERTEGGDVATATHTYTRGELETVCLVALSWKFLSRVWSVSRQSWRALRQVACACVAPRERGSCLLPTHPPWGVVSRGFCLRHPLLGSLGVVGLGSVGVAAESNPPLPYMLLHTECIRMTQHTHTWAGRRHDYLNTACIV